MKKNIITRIIALLFATALFINLRAQSGNEKPGPLQEPVLTALRNTVFTLHVNTFHSQGFYFMSYFQVRYKEVSFPAPGQLRLKWEETIGTAKIGDMDRTVNEVLIDLGKLDDHDAAVAVYQPNSNHSNLRKYAVIRFKSGDKTAMHLKQTKYEIEGDKMTQVSSQSGYSFNIALPYSDLGECTDCSPSIYLKKLLTDIGNIRKAFAVPAGQSSFDPQKFRSQLLSFLTATAASKFAGAIVSSKQDIGYDKEGKKVSIISTYYKSKLPLFDFNLELSGSDYYNVYNMRGRYQAGNAAHLLSQIQAATNNIPGYNTKLKTTDYLGREASMVIKELQIVSSTTGYPVVIFYLSNKNHLDVDINFNLPM